MRVAAVIALLALTGCKSTPKVEPLPVQPPAPTKESVVTNLGKDMDKTDHRVASALVAIEKNADKPKVVVAESRLAQSYLPEPPAGDVAFAMARATKSDPLDYKKQMEFGRQLATAVNKAWEKLEADQKEAARVSGLKDARIKELTEEVARVKQEASQNIWTLTGAALFVAGALATAFVGPRIGIPLLACAALAGAVPFIYDSPYFLWVAIGTFAIASGFGLWWVWDKVRDAVNSSNGKRD
jgi:outer membrane murein-binding lipoprotein Lpp